MGSELAQTHSQGHSAGLFQVHVPRLFTGPERLEANRFNHSWPGQPGLG